MGAGPLDEPLLERLYRAAEADRWKLPRLAFARALEASAARTFSPAAPSSRALSRYLSGLQLNDVALACACAEGHADAWDHFVAEFRPILYRAADALEPGGGAREVADSLYAELYGIDQRGDPRQSLLRQFHGRSSLATWLRAVLSQRYVDRIRARRRTEPLEEDVAGGASAPADPECAGYVARLGVALRAALAHLEPRDRLRLACYYVQKMTLAETGRLLKEHEATVSRQLARARTNLRALVERDLRAQGLADAQIARCFECAIEDVGALSLDGLCKEFAQDRS